MERRPFKYAVASGTKEATSIGIETASIGGNAVDVAVGVAFGLLVSNILMCSIGGGGFATVKSPDGKVEIIDFFDCMPGKGLNLGYFKEHARPQKVYLPYGVGIEVMIGHATVGVPGTVKGLELLLERHGTLPLKEVVQPAIELARAGIHLNHNISWWLEMSAHSIHWQTEYSKKLFSMPSGEVPDSSYLFKMPDLANSLQIIGQHGSDAVYKGDIAEAIVEEISKGGGLITYEDIASYEAIVRKPLETTYREKYIYTNPPPSVGGVTLVELMNIVSHIDFEKMYKPQLVTTVGKAIRLALHDKFTRYLDPSTNEEVAKELLCPEYTFQCFKKITPGPNTTHLSSIDDEGYAVGITMSMGYGSGVGISGTGIVMDNVLGEMELNPQGYLKTEPGQRLISGMTPTIMVNEDTNDVVVLGTPGASRIAPCLMQIIINLIDHKMDLYSAISSPRIHYEDNTFVMEPGIEVDENLLDKRVKVVKFDKIDMSMGGAECVRLKEGLFPEAASDPRRSGSAQTLVI